MNKEKTFYYQQLIERRIKLIEQMRKINVIKPEVVSCTACFSTEIIEACPSADKFSPIKIPYNYGGVDEYMWTTARFRDLEPNTKYFGYFDFGTGAGGLTVGAETLLYVNGQEHAGVDLNHREVAIGYLASDTDLYFRTWTGIADESRLSELEYIQGKKDLGQYHQVSKLELFELDEKVNNLYYNLYAMIETYKTLEKKDVTNAAIIINDLRQSLLKYDELDFTREKLYEINEEVEQMISKYQKSEMIDMLAVGQTHIDLAWLWRVKHTREKTARSFSTMLNLIKENPEFTFLQSQPQLFEFLKQDYPNLFARIKEAVKDGNLEIDGAMWLESDCNIPSGESLTRQILYGKQFIRQEFDSDSKLLWMPDVFGYSVAMPQILKKSGVDVFCTTKMQWNKVNRMPFNSFKWRGLDGSEITTHLIEDFKFWDINPDSMITGWEQYKDKDLTNQVLYQHGFGDGGGGPRQQDIELVKRYDKMPGLPKIRYEKASKYFNRLDESLEQADSYVHVWDGEMYLELHRGTFTSQALMKKLNRKYELELRDLEMQIVKALQMGHNVRYLNEKIEASWKKLLLNQFHDIIPGSSIHRVYEDAKLLYDEIESEIEKVKDELYSNYQVKDNSFVVFNNYHLPIDTVFNYKSKDKLSFSCKGQRLVSEQTEDGYRIAINNLAPLAYTKIDIEEAIQNVESLQLENKYQFENKFYKIKFNKLGQIDYLFDKEVGKNVVADGKVFNKLVSYEDRPLDWDAWDIDIFYTNRERIVDNLINYRVKSSSKIETIIELEYQHLESSIIQEIVLSNVTPRIDFKTVVDYNNQHRLLRVLFETDIRATKARYDIQYGNVERANHKNTTWEMQKFEVLAHRWADISNSSYGVSVLNDCKYGYSCDGGTIGLSLIKAATFPDPVQDIGNHEFTYSVYVHSNDVLLSDIETQAHDLNNHLQPIKVDVDSKPIIQLPYDSIAVDAIKPAVEGNDIIVRIHEWKNSYTKLQLEGKPISVDLLERDYPEKLDEIANYQVKSFKLKEGKDD